jgi:hypothetical protein
MVRNQIQHRDVRYELCENPFIGSHPVTLSWNGSPANPNGFTHAAPTSCSSQSAHQSKAHSASIIQYSPSYNVYPYDVETCRSCSAE